MAAAEAEDRGALRAAPLEGDGCLGKPQWLVGMCYFWGWSFEKQGLELKMEVLKDLERFFLGKNSNS